MFTLLNSPSCNIEAKLMEKKALLEYLKTL
jgi:hypothetical protein